MLFQTDPSRPMKKPGGGVGGILYTARAGVVSWAHYNGRGDVVTRTSGTGSLTYAASYEAFGTRTQEAGTNPDRQRANTKEEDPTGLLNEGHRYRDLELGMFISRDPAGFVDGPNVYTYVVQNPWSAFDPEGLFLGALFTKFDQHVLQPVGNALGEGLHSAVQYVAGEAGASAVFNSGAFDAATNTLGAVATVSHEGLKTLSPGDAAMEKALEGDLKAAMIEGGKELAGGKIAKIGGKIVGSGMGTVSDLAKRGGKHVDDAPTPKMDVNPSAGGVADDAAGLGTTARETAGEAESLYRGGVHSETKLPVGDGLDSHHMPAKSVSGIPAEKGPSIQMDPSDHKLTSSHSHQPGSIEYRAEIGQMIQRGNMRGAMAAEIRDVRRAAHQGSGNRTKYNKAMIEMMERARNDGNIPKNPKRN